jgi:hypothetical protein
MSGMKWTQLEKQSMMVQRQYIQRKWKSLLNTSLEVLKSEACDTLRSGTRGAPRPLFSCILNESSGVPMNTTLTAEQIEDYSMMLCDALVMNLKEYQIRSHKRSIANEINMDYHQQKIDEIMENGPDVEFYVKLLLIVKMVICINQQLGNRLLSTCVIA